MKDVLNFLDGNINHQRIGKVKHSFKNKHLFCLIDILKIRDNSLSVIKDKPWFFSINRFNLLSLNINDFGQRDSSKIQDLTKYILKISNIKKCDKIYLFCFPKTLGFGFNPLSVYFIYNRNKLIKNVYEVKNTFGDIHHYVTRGSNKDETFNKKMFVSPFYDNDGYYSLFSSINGGKLFINVNYLIKKQILFKANVTAYLIESSKLKIFNLFLKTFTFPSKVWLNIHYEALKLFLKRIKIKKIPNEQAKKYSFSKLNNK